MRFIFALLLSLVLLITFTMAALLSVEEEFASFKTKHDKQYETPEEEARRFELFKETYERVKKNNEDFEAGRVSFTTGLNQFADWTKEEMSRMMGKSTKAKPGAV